MSRLEATSELKAAFINNWFSYRFLDLESQATSLENAHFLLELRDAFQSGEKEVEDFVRGYDWAVIAGERGTDLKAFRRTYGYYDVYLIDSEGNILFTTMGKPDLGTNLFDGPLS